MADISAEITAFQNAVYGEDVRGALIDLANAVNSESSTAAETVSTYNNRLTAVEADGYVTTAKLDDGAVTDAKLVQSGGVLEEVSILRSDLSNLRSDLSNYLVTLTWFSGYVSSVGKITDGSNSRKYSNLVPCVVGETLLYVAESDHSSVSGISFWGDDGSTFIDGESNIGDKTAEHQVIVPQNAKYCRISATNNQVSNGTASVKIQFSYERDYTIGATIENTETIIKIADLDTFTEKLTGTFVSYSSTELRGTYAVEGDETLKIIIDNTSGNLRYSIRFMQGETLLGATTWITDTDAIYYLPDYYSDVDSIVIRLQNATGSGSININRSIDLYVYESLLIIEKINKMSSKINVDRVYVDGTNGDDTNDGMTRSNAFKTIQAAVNVNTRNVFVREGTYAPFNVTNKCDLTISIDHFYDSYTAGTDQDDPKIVIDGSSSETYGIFISNSSGIMLEGFEVKDCVTYGVIVRKSSDIEIVNCIAHDIYNATKTNAAMGFAFVSADANARNCLAYNIGTIVAGTGSVHSDGFNIHDTGMVNFYNCSAYNCEDDGVSHHDACCGEIDGGEWYNCGKGGIASPTHGATVNVKNVYSHHNRYGVYIDNQNATGTRPNVLVNGCVFKNNSDKDVKTSSFYKVILMNCIYDTIESGDSVIYNQ